jgi:hypothetical protein
MVSGINGNFSLRSLEIVKNELLFLPTDHGEITDETNASMSAQGIRAIKYFGNSKLSLGNKVEDLIEQHEAKIQTSKEASPDMDLNLEPVDVPRPKNI